MKYYSLEDYKKCLSYIGFEVDYHLNALSEEYIDGKKASSCGLTECILFETGFAVIKHNDAITQLLVFNPEQLISKLISFVLELSRNE